MKAIFADTFYWIAVTNIRDVFHRRATTLALPTSGGVLCTTEEVLTEYLNYFAGWGPNFRRKASMNVQYMMANRTVRVVSQTPSSFYEGLSLFGARLDKGYSLTDCISMGAMRREGIEDVLTNDAHFAQEGFRPIFR